MFDSGAGQSGFLSILDIIGEQLLACTRLADGYQIGTFRSGIFLDAGFYPDGGWTSVGLDPDGDIVDEWSYSDSLTDGLVMDLHDIVVSNFTHNNEAKLFRFRRR